MLLIAAQYCQVSMELLKFVPVEKVSAIFFYGN